MAKENLKVTSIKLNMNLVNEVGKILGITDRSEVIHIALKRIIGRRSFKDKMGGHVVKLKNKKNLLIILLFLSSLILSSCLNGNGYGKQEPSLPIALEAGSVGRSDTLKTLNLPDLRKPAPLAEEKERVTLEGEIICLACELKKDFQANSQCEKYGHQNLLRAYDGNVYTFIENDKTSNLIRKAEYQGKIIRVIGNLFKETNIIDVISFEIIEK